jgi:Tfp pilus assembly protein PilF
MGADLMAPPRDPAGCRVLRPVRALWQRVRRRPGVSAFAALFISLTTALVGVYSWAGHEFRAAEQALREERLADARRHVAFCRSVWPHDTATFLLAARIEREDGDYARAESLLLRCTRLHKETPEAVQLQWLLLRALRGEVDEVDGGLWACVVNGHPQTVEILATLARANMRLLRFGAALVCLNKWLERDPEAVRAFDWRGWVMEKTDHPVRAIQDYLRALELDEGRFSVRLRLVEVYLDNANPGEALPHVERLFREHPQRPDVLLAVARARLLEGRPDEARQQFDAVLAAEPDNAKALYHRARLDEQTGRPVEAEARVRQALRLEPYDPPTHYLLYLCLRQQPDREREAAAALDRYREVTADATRLSLLLNRTSASPPSPARACEIGTLLLRTGQQQHGLHWLHTALNRDPSHRPAHQALAEYYERTNQPEKAGPHRAYLGPPTPR